MKEIPSEDEMFARMAAYCSAAERCPFDVERKLSAAGLSTDAAGRILNRLTGQNYLDENRYARSFTNDKLRFNSWGRVRIAHELYQKRISPEVIDNAIAGVDQETYCNVLHELLKSKIKTMRGEDNRETRLKLLRFASGRGFEYDQINQCLAQLLKKHDDTFDDTFDDMY